MSTETVVEARDDVRLVVQLVGEGRRTLVVPGTGNEADFLPLARHRRVAFYDVRNRGRSDPVGDDGRVGIPAEVEDVDAVRSAVGFRRPSLLGWSYVGLVVALYAASPAADLDRLVLVCPAAPSRALEPESIGIDDAVLERLAALAATDLARSDPVAFARAWRRITVPLGMGDPRAFDRLEADPSIWPNEWPEHMLRALARVAASHPAEFDYRTRAESIVVPTLVVHGAADAIPVEASEAWAASIPDARLLVLPEVGHFPHVEAPAAFFGAVETFLDGRWPDHASSVEG